MKKRLICLLLAVILIFSGLGTKLFFISRSDIAAESTKNKRNITIASSRGMIYDRNKNPITCKETETVLIAKPTPSVLNKLKNKENFENIENEYKKGSLIIKKSVDSETIPEDDNILLVSVKKRYTEHSLCHITGYTNGAMEGVCGIEKYCNRFLTKNCGELTAIYETDALGRVLLGEDIEMRKENFESENGVILTIDNRIQKICETAMINGNIYKGCVVVLEVSSCDIVACVSYPDFDRNEPEKYINDEDSPFINRAFSAYPVGSVFKVVTAAAAIEANIKLPQYNCIGSITKSGTTFHCSNRNGHGNLSLSEAIEKSCNPYFIELANEVGTDFLLKTAEKFGFGKENETEGIDTQKGNLPTKKELNSEAAVANFGFGQGSLTATPLQVALAFRVLASGGCFKNPTLIKGYYEDGVTTINESTEEDIRILKESTCRIINRALCKVIERGTGKEAYSENFSACGKTATAQTGQVDTNGNEICHTWFAGFFPYENPKYVVVILKENGASGGSDDAPIFKEISEKITQSDYFTDKTF